MTDWISRSSAEVEALYAGFSERLAGVLGTINAIKGDMLRAALSSKDNWRAGEHDRLISTNGAISLLEQAAVLLHQDRGGPRPKLAKTKSPRERAARALCRRAGNPEDTKFEGKPMWMSYLDEVDAVLQAALTAEEWQKMREADVPR